MKKHSLSLIIVLTYFVVGILSSMEILFPSFEVTNYQSIHSPPSWQYPFGTDLFGRNVLARIVHGTKTSLFVGFLGAGLSIFIGGLLGALAGYFKGITELIITWVYSVVDTIPYILLVSAFAIVFGQGITSITIAIGLTSWVPLCRVLKNEVRKHKHLNYVQSAHSLGAGSLRQIFIHILPNLQHIIGTYFLIGFILAIKTEVILSYLGLGVEPGTPSWGLIISDSIPEVMNGIWWSLAFTVLFMAPLLLSMYRLHQNLEKELPQNSI